MSDLSPITSYRLDSRKSIPEQLASLLGHYGLKDPLPFSNEDEELVDLAELVDLLPPRLESGLNPAHTEMESYLMAIPPRRRALGVHVRAEHLLGTLLDRAEFFEKLQRGLVRMCKGRDCPHYSVCPFAPEMSDLTVEDRVPCAVEREVVRDAVRDFATPNDSGLKPPVDPRRPEQALLFKELVELLVKKTRLSMYLQAHDMLVEQWEVLKDGEIEKFDTMNQVEHPLLASWDRTTSQILRVMKDLGITPEFQIRQGLYVDDASQIDAERRSKELAEYRVRDGLKKLLSLLPEDDPNRALIAQAMDVDPQTIED
jgi:hypothetical protein